MINPISLAFKNVKKQNRPALLTYTVAGDSSKKKSLDILQKYFPKYEGNAKKIEWNRIRYE